MNGCLIESSFYWSAEVDTSHTNFAKEYVNFVAFNSQNILLG